MFHVKHGPNMQHPKLVDLITRRKAIEWDALRLAKFLPLVDICGKTYRPVLNIKTQKTYYYEVEE